MQPEQMTATERAALERLLEHGRGMTDQSRRVADFLLAWWNAGSCGSYAHHRLGRGRGDRRGHVRGIPSRHARATIQTRSVMGRNLRPLCAHGVLNLSKTNDGYHPACLCARRR
jgi:hypothetical protein